MGKSLTDATGRLNALDKKVQSMTKPDGPDANARIDAIEKRVGDLAGSLEAAKAELAARNTPAAVASNELDQAIDLFKKGKFADAKDAFTKLETVTPDDARVWYFAALANGLATSNWKGESERLVTEGMAREKAGKPDKAKIDAAFSNLIAATGKDWLAYYRGRAAEAPERR